MKKVLFVATVTKHINTFHIPYLKWFKEQGYEVHVASNGNEKIEYCDKHYDLPFERFPIKKNNFKTYKELKKIIDDNSYEIVHCHTPVGGVLTRLAARKARKNGTRVIYTAHGFHFYKGAPLLNWIIYYPIEKICARWTDILITIVKEDYEIAKKKLKKAKQIEHIYGIGMNTERFEKDFTIEEKQEIKNKLGIKKEDTVFSYVAELNKNKNQILLIDVIKELKKENPNVKLLLVGDGPLMNHYKEYTKKNNLEDNIKILGIRKDVNEILSITDIYLASSIREGLPVNVMEAMYKGLPVIATNNRGHRELVKNNENGFIVKSKYEMKEKIEKILNEKVLINKFSTKGKYLVEKYNIKNTIKKIKNIYRGEKMKLLYVHTAEKVKMLDCKEYYTDGAYDEKVWNRYLNFSENNVTFYATLDPNKYKEKYVREKYNKIPNDIKVVTTNNITSSIFSYFNFKTRYYRRKQIEKLVMEADVIIIRTPCNVDTTVVKYAKKYNKPYMLEVVGCIWDSLWNYNYKGKILAPISFAKMKRLIKISKYSIYVTNEFLQKRYPTKGKSMNCSDVILTNLDDEDLKKRIDRINKKKTKFILGTSAAVDVRYKGQENVIKAVSKLVEKGYNIEYQLIGSGNQERLKKIAKKYKVADNVEFLGSIPHSKVFEWLEDVDIYIQPSKQEGLPRALIEAMSKACPSIGTKIAGIPELIDKRCLYEKNDIGQLTEKIENFIKNSDFMTEQAKYNFSKAKEYDIEIINKRRFEFYDVFKKENKL